MRRLAKASSVGSTFGQASRLASFARAFSVRDGSLRADGTSATSVGPERSRSRVRSGLTALIGAAAILALAFSPGLASAADSCPNAVFRTGPSAKLPECRAYELVSPEYSGGIPPGADTFGNSFNGFEGSLINAAGDSVIFHTVGGALSAFPGSGYNDQYRARRTASGWETGYFAATPEYLESINLASQKFWPGGFSPDHEYYFWRAAGENFIHAPTGDEPIGIGSLGTSPLARGRFITNGGKAIIFETGRQLEPEAPEGQAEGSAAHTNSVYRRSVDGPTEVISLLPGDVTPVERADYLGQSDDATQVAFQVGEFGEAKPLYVRADDSTRTAARPDGVKVGDELTCSGSPGTATLAYQWLRDGVSIGGATNATYTVAVADAGSVLQCQVSATAAGEGTVVSVSQNLDRALRVVAPYTGSNPPLPTRVILRSENGLTVGETVLCAKDDDWEGDPAYTYQWLRDGVAIGGATDSTYTLVSGDKSKAIQCRITGTNADGAAVSFSAAPPILAGPTATAAPTISNVTDPGNPPAAGDVLSCSGGTWTAGPTLAYQWLRNGAAIGGATASTYTVTSPVDDGMALQCLVTATNADASAQAVSNRVVVDPQPGTTPPELTSPDDLGGNPEVGNTLDCREGGWSGDPTFAYQWLRNGVEIAGATGEEHTLGDADRATIVQCRVMATNAGGSVVTILEGEYIPPSLPNASASLPSLDAFTFAGVRGGHVFYADTSASCPNCYRGDLFSFDIADGTTTQITNVGDAVFTHVASQGTRAYFISESEIGGEGSAGELNLYEWTRSDESTTFIGSVEPDDLSIAGHNGAPGLANWAWFAGPAKETEDGLARSHTRSTPDDSVFIFESTAQLTAFDNVEAAADDCRSAFSPGEGCVEVYRYDAVADELTCISCPPGPGPAHGDGELQTYSNTGTSGSGLTELEPMNNLTSDGNMVFFESTDAVLPQDGNEVRDIYRWREGAGASLITTGQSDVASFLFGVTPSGSDVIFLTAEQLLPQDRNGGTRRLYNAGVDGGFPPPEETVTEPCSGDICQGTPAAAPQAPGTASSSLNGTGNVKPNLHCGKGKRSVRRRGKERCVRKHRRTHKSHRRAAGFNRRAAR